MEQKLGPYRILAELGRGGMGVVLKGYDDALRRPVAIKVLGEHVAHDQHFVARFLREAQSAAQLNHPNIVQIYFIGEDQGKHFFVMEFVEGRSVLQVVRSEGRIATPRAAEIVRQSACGLAIAHDRGVVHRDIKPANLMLCNDGLVKIADFGVAFMTEDSVKLTATGGVLGTPGYLSPEQCLAQPLDGRTDIYSLGVSFYEMLTGTIPFKADSPFAMVKQVVESIAPDVTQVNPAVDEQAAVIVRRMMAKKREERYASCHELLAALNAYLSSTDTPTHVVGAITPATGSAAARSSAPTAPRVAAAVVSRDADEPATEALVTPAAPMSRATAGTAAGRPASAVAAMAVATPMEHNVPALRAATDVAVRREAAVVAGAAAPVAKAASPRSPVLLVAAVCIGLVAAGALGLQLLKGRFVSGAGDDAALGSGDAESAPAPNAPSALAALPGGGDGGAGGGGGGEAGAVSAGIPEPPTATGSEAPGASDAGEARLGGVAGAAAAGAAGSAALGAGTVEAEPSQAEALPAVAERPAAAETAPAPGTASRQDTARGAPAAPARPAPAQRAPLPVQPRLMVAVVGEALLADALEKQLSEELRSQGYSVADSSTLPDLDDLKRSDPTIAALAGAAQDSGYQVVVLARAEALAGRELNYMGRTEMAQVSRVKLTAAVAAERVVLGPGWSTKIEYTPLTVERKVETAVGEFGSDLGQAIRSGWTSYREGGAR